MGRKFTFTVKEGADASVPCYLLEETHGVRIDIRSPGDHLLAAQVAKFLNDYVEDIVVATGTISLSTGGQTKTIGGNWASLFGDGGTEVGNG